MDIDSLGRRVVSKATSQVHIPFQPRLNECKLKIYALCCLGLIPVHQMPHPY